jgi:hypothetical protein
MKFLLVPAELGTQLLSPVLYSHPMPVIAWRVQCDERGRVEVKPISFDGVQYFKHKVFQWPSGAVTDCVRDETFHDRTHWEHELEVKEAEPVI